LEEAKSPDADLDLPMVAAAVLAGLVVEVRREHADVDLQPLFRELEAAVQSTIDRYLLVVGFLEDLQNELIRSEFGLDDFADLFGPFTADAWAKVADMWAGRVTPAAFNAFVENGAPPGSTG